MAGSEHVAASMLKRLRLYEYDKDACQAAIRGEKVPYALGLPLTRRCLIRGIRYYDGFGEELRGALPIFTRALNARTIMSNHVPDIDKDDDIPYCIWYPQIATEDTYRRLARRYPSMAYHVGRACAVAGYQSPYKELDILPDTHIAEEARECENVEIYNYIMLQPMRYDVMNDYTRTINADPKAGAYLNGDTAVCRTLEKKQQYWTAEEPEYINDTGEPEYFGACLGYETNTFDITEDMNIGEISDTGVVRESATPTSPVVLELLTAPLPFDLPTIDKDLLILMAAYDGNIDRYVRLRRPEPLPQEENCCVRGIYHNTMFALWWAHQESSSTNLPDSIRKAISARMIMNNVLDRMDPANSRVIRDPYLIWYPSIAAESTYRELFRIRPSMGPQILRACIAARYVDVFKVVSAKTEPDTVVLREARAAGGVFKDVIEQRVSEVGEVRHIKNHQSWKKSSPRDLERVGNTLSDTVGIRTEYGSLYDGLECNAQEVEMLVSMPQAWKRLPGWKEGGPEFLDYKDWPIARK